MRSRSPARASAKMVEAVVDDGTGAAEPRVLQPAVARAQLRSGTEVVAVREARRVPRQAAADEPDRRRARPRRRTTTDRRDRADLPAVGEGRRVHVGAPALVVGALACRGAGLRRSARRPRPRPGRARRSRRPRCAAIHQPESMDELERGAAPAALRRVPPHAGRARRAQARDRGRGVGHRARVDGELVAAFLAGLPYELTGDQARAIDEITATSRARRRCTGCCRARSARARRSSRSPRCSSRCRAATRARSWRRPRCSPSSSTSVARAARRAGRAERGPLLAERPVRVALLTNRTPAAERRRIARRAGGGRRRHRRRHARAALRRRAVHAARARGDRRAAPLRRRAARAAARQGRRSPTSS